MTLTVHILGNYFLVYYWDFGVVGGAFCQIISNTFHITITTFYIHYIKPFPEASFLPDMSIVYGIIPYLKFVLPIVFIYCALFWSNQIQSIICSKMSAATYQEFLIAMGASIFSLCAIKGAQSAAAIITGKEIIKGNASHIKTHFTAFFVSSATIQLIILIGILIFQRPLTNLFVNSTQVDQVSSNGVVAMTAICFAMIADSTFTGIFKGLGKQTLATINYFICVFLIQFSILALFLIYCPGLQFYSFIYSRLCYSICCNLAYIAMISLIDFDQLRIETLVRVAKDSKKKKEELEREIKDKQIANDDDFDEESTKLRDDDEEKLKITSV